MQDNNTYRKAQERMESQIYAQEQDLAQAQKDNQLLKKRNKDLEKRLENEVQGGCVDAGVRGLQPIYSHGLFLLFMYLAAEL